MSDSHPGLASSGSHAEVAQADDLPPVGQIFRIGVIGVVITVAAAFVSLAFQRSVEASTPSASSPAAVAGTSLVAGNYGVLHREYFVEKPGENANGEAQRLRREQSALLQNYSWVDRPRGLIRIPIDSAIDQVVAAYGQQK